MADTKVTALVAITPLGTDLLYAVDDPGGTPISAKVTVAAVLALAPGSASGTDVAVADGGTGASTASAARDNLGLGTANSPQLTGIELGHATDTTLTRASAGVVAVEGVALVRATDDATGQVTAASASAAGKVELATTAETDTGTDAARAVTPDGIAGSIFGTKEVSILVFDDSQNVAVADAAGDVFWRVPSTCNGMNLVAVAAHVQTAGTTGTTDIQIARTRAGSSVDMLTTKLTIDSTEVDTVTAAAAAVINATNDDVATGDRIRIDVDAVSTTPPKGLLVELQFRLP
jgi:hypothetical protein